MSKNPYFTPRFWVSPSRAPFSLSVFLHCILWCHHADVHLQSTSIKVMTIKGKDRLYLTLNHCHDKPGKCLLHLRMQVIR